VYLRLGDFLVSCVAQLISRKAVTYSLVFSSDQVLCSRIVRFIVTGHDGILPVYGALPAPIVPHNSETQQPRTVGPGAGPQQEADVRAPRLDHVLTPSGTTWAFRNSATRARSISRQVLLLVRCAADVTRLWQRVEQNRFPRLREVSM
jgi:hypothetical protein